MTESVEGSNEKSKFDRVLSRWDVIMIALGAMIGWGWVVSSGSWIETGGVVGAMIGFAAGGLMVFFVGLTYAELTSAMPKCGGEHVFAMRAFGPTGSFICTWAIVLGYLGVTCFEACTIPLCISYIWPNFLQGYLYTIAGFDVYVTWIVSAILIGGATVNKASITNVIIGTILYQGIVSMTPSVMNSLIHTDMSEVLRIIVSNGMILYALTRKTGASR